MTADLILIAAKLTCALVLGGMAFFSFVYAPLVFIKLPAEEAGRFIRAIFPVYYWVMAGLAGAAALSAWGRPDAAVLGGVAALFILARFVLMPRMDAAREARAAGDEAGRARFARLHRLSVAVNTIQMLAVLAVFVRLTS